MTMDMRSLATAKRIQRLLMRVGILLHGQLVRVIVIEVYRELAAQPFTVYEEVIQKHRYIPRNEIGDRTRRRLSRLYAHRLRLGARQRSSGAVIREHSRGTIFTDDQMTEMMIAQARAEREGNRVLLSALHKATRQCRP